MTTLPNSSGYQTLVAQLGRWDRRRLLNRALTWVPRGLLGGLLGAVVVAAVARLRPLLDEQQLLLVILVTGSAGLLVGLGWTMWQRHTLWQQARFADQQFTLQERTATAVEIESGHLLVPAHIAEQQLADTLHALESVDTQAQYPLQLQRQDILVLALAIVLLIIAFLLPNPQLPKLQQQRAITAEIEEQIGVLEVLEEEILNNPELSDEQREELLEPIQSALSELEQPGLSQEEAVASLSEAEAELRVLEEENAVPAGDILNEAGSALANNENSQSLGESIQNGDFGSAASAAAALAEGLDGLTLEEQAALAEDLAEAAAALEEADPELSQELADAASALENGDVAAAQGSLNEAAGTLTARDQESAVAAQAGNSADQLAQGRESVAQAGQEGEGQGQQAEGQGQQGEGQQGQGQQGEGQSQGQGQGQTGQGQGQGQGNQDGTGQGGPGPGGGHTENVYAPELVDLGGEEGVEIELPAECRANPSACGSLLSETDTEFSDEESLVPYDQVYGDYRDAAYEALDDDYVPLGYREFIRDYFSSLEP